MVEIFPDYYKEFACVKGDCRHSCCIGWEIDIDEDTLSFYDKVPGPFGERLRENIELSDEPHFRLGEGERCPFLNGEGLCDLIITLGEEHLCGICDEHPRFYNELPGRVEGGLGLCCEAAAKLVLGKKEPVTLVSTGDVAADDPIILLRDEVLALLQDRRFPVEERVERMLARCGVSLPVWENERLADIFLSLERLDESWTGELSRLKGAADLSAFRAATADRRTEYEQFLVYLVYRHFANASDFDNAAVRAAFAALGFHLLESLGAARFAEAGAFTFEEQCELVRLFSSEVEYSDENRFALFDLLEASLTAVG